MKLLLVVPLLAATLPGCYVTRLRLASPENEIVETRDIVYRPASKNPKHRLDVYAPSDARDAAVVHFVHGGYWRAGDKDYVAPITGLYGTIGEALAARGVVTVVQSYRLVPEVSFDDLVDDVMAGLKWTEDHVAAYGGDRSRVFMMGHSAGGHLVALAGADPSLHTKRGMDPFAVRGYIPISAVWDVADMHATQDAAFNERVTYRVFGRDPAAWSAASPIDLLAGTPRPFFVIVGERDYPYMIPEARRAVEKLRSLGGEPASYVAPGNGHDEMVLEFGAYDDAITPAVVDWVNRIP